MLEAQSVQTLKFCENDHVKRYEFAANYIVSRGWFKHVVDMGCGNGFGSYILSEYVEHVTCIDNVAEHFNSFCKYYSKPNIRFMLADIFEANLNFKCDVVVCFELLEITDKPEELLEILSQTSNNLIISTSNELIRPHKIKPVHPEHLRHYTPDQLNTLLEKFGYKIKAWFNQHSKSNPDVRIGNDGKYMIAIAHRE